MAIKSTIFKANLSIADIDHNYYADHNLTLARHPSETDERMMVRLVALALNAHQLQDLCNGDGTLGFGIGLSDPDDPASLVIPPRRSIEDSNSSLRTEKATLEAYWSSAISQR